MKNNHSSPNVDSFVRRPKGRKVLHNFPCSRIAVRMNSYPQKTLYSLQQTGFTLVEMIMVMVITGILGGMVAVFLKAPIQQYQDVARRAELTDITDIALYRLTGDISTAVPNSVRVAGCGTTPCVEFLPTKNGGRYRAMVISGAASAVAGDILDFTIADSSFDILGHPLPLRRMT